MTVGIFVPNTLQRPALGQCLVQGCSPLIMLAPLLHGWYWHQWSDERFGDHPPKVDQRQGWKTPNR